MGELSREVKDLRGIGPKRAAALEKLGIVTLWDLLSWFPRRYEDRRAEKAIGDLVSGESVCVRAMIAHAPAVSHIRQGLDLVKVRAVDDTGALDITFFNQTWLKNELIPGETYVFFGKAEVQNQRRTMAGPVVEREGQREATGRIVPVYPLTAGVSQLVLRRCVREGLDACAGILPDALPGEIRQKYGLCRVGYAYEHIHFPENEEALSLARRRLAFEELFLLSIGLRRLRRGREACRTEPFQAVDLSPFYNALPFTLTAAQRRCIQEAAADLYREVPMNRLCQGDVGSGKTMVAAACGYLCGKNRRQAALMAPTELLARQHFGTLSPLLEPLGLRCALLTGSTPAKEKREIGKRLAAGEIDFLIGTHALISGGVEYAGLGLVITDEQHRFGVAQRSALSAKGVHPHTLVMSATPIPRTLALILYGDLDVSVLDELPPGRKPVETYAVPGSYRPRIYKFLEKLMAQGRQAYIVCPMVEEGEDPGAEERKAVLEYARHLKEEVFPHRQVAYVHGRMKAKEKDAAMSAFARGEAEILVSTTVVEVGVDVPNAAVMVVENAERFGLSQLHQLRGRVGRGTWQSYCILISDNRSPETKQRLQVMTRTQDGFQVAEEDLRLRGPGDFFGQRQHGIPGLKVANLALDAELLRDAQAAAEALLTEDPDLKQHPATAERAAALLEANADGLN